MKNTQREKPKWFSIQEAADYLEVGEPTLYRWMKERKITFRKVGDSTRFLQSDLDEVVQVYPSNRPQQNGLARCPVCYSEKLVEGRVRGAGLVYFEPKQVRFWTLRDSSVQTTCRMCQSCGTISWRGDVSKLQALRKRRQTKDDSGGRD